MLTDIAVSTEDVASLNRLSRKIYFDVLTPADKSCVKDLTQGFLAEQLEIASCLDADMPQTPEQLWSWLEEGVRQVGSAYRQYLAERKAGKPRRYFTTRAHALYFLKIVAPTKMVDGAWLYGLTKSWNDARLGHLIQIYLEELGEGRQDKNHVSLFRELLATHGCDQWEALPDEYFLQGAIQLALAHNADEYLPEVVGFNLGYEQLPLHLLITAYELNELGIDPYYFTLHVTVDNAAAGHAKKAVQAVFDAMPNMTNRDVFFKRVMNGYKLNSLGLGTTAIIDGFNLERELIAILASKCATGSQLHSDYCRVAGKTVNQWLSDSSQLPEFLASLQALGWIRRNEDPENSRFWRLIEGENSEMFGVFNAYERQVIHDWIAGDKAKDIVPRRLSYKAKHRMLNTLAPGLRKQHHDYAERGILRDHGSRAAQEKDSQEPINEELRVLEERIACCNSKPEAMHILTDLMVPGMHHTPTGLMATRLFLQLWRKA